MSGAVPKEDRDEIIKILKSKENSHGEIINLLLLSGTGAEGIDLNNMRFVMIMEPYWNEARIQQVSARAIRWMSHSTLPQNERNAQVYIYLSDYPSEYSQPKHVKPELTTDLYIYNKALNNQKLINNFLITLISASVDCNIFTKLEKNGSKTKRISCKMCRPTNKPLYGEVMLTDLEMPNPCIMKSLSGEESGKSGDALNIKLKELILEGDIKLYYNIDPEKKGESDESNDILSRIHVYKYDENLGGYMELSSGDPLYPVAVQKIM